MKIIFIVPPKVHLLDLNGPAHIFYEAKCFHPQIELCFASIDATTEIESSAGLFFSKLTSYRSYCLSKEDIIFLPGIDYSLLTNSVFLDSLQDFFQWLRLQYASGTTICSVCTGSFLLAEAGLLNNKSCTTHWRYFDEFANRYPEIELKRNRLFCDDEGIFTSAGVSSGIDLSLFILEKLFGQKFAFEIAKETVVYFRRGNNDPQLSVFLQYRNHLEERIYAAQEYIFENSLEKIKIENIADHVCMSPRNLTRLFKKTTGITIGEYLNQIRCEKAKSLIADGHKLDYVALNCGFNGTAKLKNDLKNY